MERLRHLITEGGPYYSHGEVECADCSKVGKIIESISLGEYTRVDPLTIAEVSFLITVAQEHKAENLSHHPVIFEYRRNRDMSESKQWTELTEKRRKDARKKR